MMSVTYVKVEPFIISDVYVKVGSFIVWHVHINGPNIAVKYRKLDPYRRWKCSHRTFVLWPTLHQLNVCRISEWTLTTNI